MTPVGSAAFQGSGDEDLISEDANTFFSRSLTADLKPCTGCGSSRRRNLRFCTSAAVSGFSRRRPHELRRPVN
jgi:hypothetical protein